MTAIVKISGKEIEAEYIDSDHGYTTVMINGARRRVRNEQVMDVRETTTRECRFTQIWI